MGSVLDPTLLSVPQYPFEALFRSQHYALLDNSCREYLFICEFFVVSGPAAHDLFHAVMGRTLAMTLVSPWSLCFTLRSQGSPTSSGVTSGRIETEEPATSSVFPQ